MIFYRAVQKLLVEDTKTDTQIGDLISLLSLSESRLKMKGHAYEITSVSVCTSVCPPQITFEPISRFS
jgi:hypothetical protein